MEIEARTDVSNLPAFWMPDPFSSAQITKIFTFDAAHSLPFHRGKCKNLHGHTYKLEVTLKGELGIEGASEGMVMDFGMLKDVVQEFVLQHLDHCNLNDLFENPTAELMAVWIFEVLDKCLQQLVKIRLWETPTSYAEVTR